MPRASASHSLSATRQAQPHTGHASASGSFFLDSTNHPSWQLLRDNAYLGIHEMTVTGKALTAALYSTEPRYSYFMGCSTGGRQGLSEVQRYPDDYNGVVAGAPATNWTKLHIEQLWGNLNMMLAGRLRLTVQVRRRHECRCRSLRHAR